MIKKLTQLFPLFLFSINVAYSQAPAIEWQNCIGGVGAQDAFGMQQTSDGGYISCGINEYATSVIKLDATGALSWEKVFPYGGALFCIRQTTDGGYIAAGNDGSSTTDYFVIRLDGAGNVIWHKTYGGSLGERVFSIIQTTDGGFILGGECLSTDGDVTGSHGGGDAWIVKLDGLGNIVWKRAYGGSSSEEVRSIKQTPDGGYIFIGSAGSTDGDLLGTAGMTGRCWIVKLDANGNIQWQKRYGSNPGGEAGLSICLTSDGGYAAVAMAYYNGGDVTGVHGAGDFWVIKMDATGALQWQKAFGGSQLDFPTCIIESTHGCLVILGDEFSDDGDVTGNHGGPDYWVVKLSSTGSLLWQKAMGGFGGDFPYTICQTTDQGFAMAGYTASNNTGDVGSNPTLPVSNNYWIVKLASEIKYSTINVSICASALPYTWNGQSYNAAGTYTVTLEGSNGADSIPTLNLTVNPVSTSTTNTTICNNQLPYSWNGNDYTGAGTYSVTLVGSTGCDSTATLNLVVSPVVTSNSNISICNNQLPYNWNGNIYPIAGTYSAILTSSAGCDSIATLSLATTMAPIVNLGKDTTLCSGKTLSLDVTTSNANYLWQDGSINTVYTITREGFYWVKLNVNGCESSDTIVVDFKDCNCVAIIPNAFTPNGDGINDKWVISNHCGSRVIVSVYNRYGTVVYHSDNYQDDWKGKYKSEPCPDGTYYYIVRLLYANQKERVFKGDVTILR